MNLKELRTVKGWSREELARRAGVSVDQIAELESDRKEIITTTKTLLRLARALGRNVAEMFC